MLGRQAKEDVIPGTAQYHADTVLELLLRDLRGKISPPTQAGNQYFLLLVDDKSIFMSVVLLPSKDHTTDAIKKFKLRAESESGRKFRGLKTDRGGEFNLENFSEFYLEQGVRRQLMVPYSPQQNGVVERHNATVVGAARSMLKAKGLPNQFWGEAVLTAVYILNRTPTRSVKGVTPFEVWYGRKPSVHHFCTFGCIVYVKNTKPFLSKLDDRGRRMIFIGYEQGTKAYRVYDPMTDHVHITRDVIFDEAGQWDMGSSRGS
jgi:hypothetical protein